MAVYLTKSMLTKLNKVKYPTNRSIKNEGATENDHWLKLINNKASVQLTKEMICRVCARSACHPLSDDINEDYDIMSAICSVSNVNITVEDSLPKYICTTCLENLKIALDFKLKCEDSERKFKKILNPMDDPSFHSYPYSKHDFQLILHQMKLKRMKAEEKREAARKKKEKILQRKLPKVKQFKCSPCDMTFPNKELLVGHRRERQCMRRACDICGQLVLSIAQHMRHIHKQASPHKCTTCGKEFPIIARLKNHMLVHTDTFNFYCDLCPYKCKHKYYLVMHMRTHTGEKPYKCAQCAATFVNPSNLNKHKLTHQEKQFKCMLCEKAFRTSTALREHHEAAHMHIKHTCSYCGRDFCYKSDLRKHEIRNHNRVKRDYVGGEPSYKQAERQAKLQESEAGKWPHEAKLEGGEADKWRHHTKLLVTEADKWRLETNKLQESEADKWRHEAVAPTLVQTGYITDKEFIATNQTIYYPEPPSHPQMVQPSTLQMSLSELLLKKDDVKLFETQQDITYY